MAIKKSSIRQQVVNNMKDLGTYKLGDITKKFIINLIQ